MSSYTYKTDKQVTAEILQKDVYIGTIKSEGGSLIRPAFFSKKMPLKYDYNRYIRHSSLVPSEFDLYQILQAENIDGYMKRAIKIKSANMFKSGWRLTGKNPETVKYIKRRLREIELASGYPFELMIRDLGRNFLRYSNAFLVKVRNASNSSGKRRTIVTKRGETTLPPVSAYFLLPPETVQIETDVDGHIVKYHQIMPNGAHKNWPAYNIIHFFYDRKAGYHMGTPVYWPALDDIRAIRRIEENLEYLIYYYVFPFFVVYVGTDDRPPATYPDGKSEIDVVTEKINYSPTEGGMVLSYRHKVDVVSFDNILPIEKYLEHFKSRIFASLGVSSVDMGEGSTSNRNTADSLTRQMIDDVKDYQQVFAAFVNFEIITELLLESPMGFSALSEENMVYFSFNEIDIDNRIKIENHNALMYQMNILTEDESRLEINREPITESERKKLYIETIQKPLAELGKKTEATLNSAAKSKQQPSNQHGENPGPTKAKSSLSNTVEEILYDFINSDDDLTLADIKNNILDIDSIEQNQLIIDRINTVFNFCEEHFNNKEDKLTIANTLEVLLRNSL